MKLESGKKPDTGSGVTYSPAEVNTSKSYAFAPATGDHTQTILPFVEALGAQVDLPSFTTGVEQRFGVAVGVGVGDFVGVGVGVGLFVGVGDGVLVGVGEGVLVGVGVGESVGVGVGNVNDNVHAAEGTPSKAPGRVGASDR